jgi:hypothetical protein
MTTPKIEFSDAGGISSLEHIPKKLTGFLDSGRPQFFGSEWFPSDQMSPSGGQAL